MFKNKFVLGIIALGLLAAMFYMFSSAPTFAEKANKKVEDYKTSLLTMEGSPIAKVGKQGISFFEPKEAWLFEAEFQKSDLEKEFVMSMTDSTTTGAKLAGTATFTVNGQPQKVLIFDEGANFLLPFKDLTNGKQTYGGGRYINIEKGELRGNKITLDFNQSHNFYCAYDPNYVCPIPPGENFMDIEVPVGELNFKR